MDEVTGVWKAISQHVGSRHCRNGITGKLHEMAVQVEDGGVLHPPRQFHRLKESDRSA